MPPKRAAPGDTAAASASTRAPKKTKTSSDTTASGAAAAKRSKRWSKVSGSRNADDAYHGMIAKDPAKYYEYVCACAARFGRQDDEDDDGWESDEEDKDTQDAAEGSKKSAQGSDKPAPCDGGRTCLCMKPADEHPEHKLKITRAGFFQYVTYRDMAFLRSPDNFDLQTWNDHEAQGMVEMVQNVFLDFSEAEGDLKAQWAVCEGSVNWLAGGERIEQFAMCEDGPAVMHASRMFGRMFLSMFATLERENLLKSDGEMKSFALTIGLVLSLASGMADFSLLEGEVSEPKSGFDWDPNNFDAYILSYAKKHGIEPAGPHDLEQSMEGLDDNLELPDASAANGDPWGWKKAFADYAKTHKPIGGDKSDITTWSSAERKAHSFSNKDPLGKKEIQAIKAGMTLHLA